jgi:iron complex outermembrane receptor protein
MAIVAVWKQLDLCSGSATLMGKKGGIHMSDRRFGTLVINLVAMAFAIAAPWSEAFSAAHDTISFYIPAQTLGQALTEFGEQADLQVMSSSHIPKADMVTSLQANYSPLEALENLLDETELKYVFDGQHNVATRPPINRHTAEFTHPGLLLASAAGENSSQRSVSGSSSPVLLAQAGDDGSQAAESPVAPDRPGVIEEIIVTAQRREQVLLEVPISMTIFSTDDIAKQNIKSAQDYLALTPNVSFAEEGQRGSRSVRISIRGINNISGNEATGSGSAIGYYYDELSVAQVSNGTINPQLIDIERVEVLRGPQGTYFGLNATGGAINVITRNPGDDPFFELSGELGTDDQHGVSTIVNLPVKDDLAVRAVAAWEETPAFVENANPAGGDSSIEAKTFRLGLLWRPLDRLSLLGKVTYTEEEQDMQELVATGINSISTQNLTGLGPTEGDDQGLGFFPSNQERGNISILSPLGVRTNEFLNNDFVILTGKATYDADAVTIEGIAGYINSDHQARFDLDTVASPFIFRTNDYDTDAWSTEVRIRSTYEGAIDWLLGGVYFNTEQSRANEILTDEAGFGPFPPLVPIERYLNETSIDSWAIFGELNWSATDWLTLTVGGRYADDEFTQSQPRNASYDFGSGTTQPIPDSGESEKQNTTDFSPRFVARADFSDDVSSYITVSKGYKPGNVRVRNVDPNNFIDEEQVWNYEVGLKSYFFDRRLLISGAIFYMDWEDLQADSLTFFQDEEGNVVQIERTINAEAASSKGAEIEFVSAVTDNLTVGGGVGYVKAEFDDFKNAVIQGFPFDLSGQQITGAPEWTAHSFADYNWPNLVGRFDGFVRAEWQFRDDQVPNIDSYIFLVPEAADMVAGDWPYRNSSYDVVNLRVGLESERFQAIVFAENLLDEEYHTGNRGGFELGGVRVRPHPRFVGAKVTFRY